MREIQSLTNTIQHLVTCSQAQRPILLPTNSTNQWTPQQPLVPTGPTSGYLQQAISQLYVKPVPEQVTAPISWAKVAARSGPDNSFITVTRKRNDSNLKLLTRNFPVAEQKVILQLESKPTITTTQCLTLPNKVLRQHTNLLKINFACTNLTERNNLVFNTSLAIRGTDYEPYFPAFQQIRGNYMASY